MFCSPPGTGIFGPSRLSNSHGKIVATSSGVKKPSNAHCCFSRNSQPSAKTDSSSADPNARDDMASSNFRLMNAPTDASVGGSSADSSMAPSWYTSSASSATSRSFPPSSEDWPGRTNSTFQLMWCLRSAARGGASSKAVVGSAKGGGGKVTTPPVWLGALGSDVDCLRR
eukprot:362877-Chlamydomonas_euryale.AAC.9